MPEDVAVGRFELHVISKVPVDPRATGTRGIKVFGFILGPVQVTRYPGTLPFYFLVPPLGPHMGQPHKAKHPFSCCSWISGISCRFAFQKNLGRYKSVVRWRSPPAPANRWLCFLRLWFRWSAALVPANTQLVLGGRHSVSAGTH